MARQPAVDPAKQRIAWTIIAQSRYDQGEFEKAEPAFIRARDLASGDDKLRSDLTERLARVAQDVQHHLLQLVGVAENHWQVGLIFFGQCNVTRAQIVTDDVDPRIGEIDATQSNSGARSSGRLRRRSIHTVIAIIEPPGSKSSIKA